MGYKDCEFEMTLGVSIISGVMLGIEFVNDGELGNFIALDLLIIRLVLEY